MTPQSRWWNADDGGATAFVVVVAVGVLALAGLVLDGGLALAAHVRAGGQAEAAARAGAQAIDLAAYRATGAVRLAPTQAVANAEAHLAAEGAVGAVRIDGDAVVVTITTHHRTQLLGLVGIDSIQVHGKGSARPVRGVTTIDP